jgi:hypothetical protein
VPKRKDEDGGFSRLQPADRATARAVRDGKLRKSMKAMQVQAVYSVAELAKGAGVPWRRLKRVLDAYGVTFLRAGKSWYVPLSELQSKVHPLWAGIVEAEHVRVLARER